MTSKQKRRLIIEPSFQYRGAWLITGVCLALAGFLIFAMSLFARHYFLLLDQEGALLSPQLSEIYNQTWTRLLIILCLVSVGYCFIIFWATLFLTRNIVGPVVGFSNRVRHLLTTGQPEPFSLRKGDELHSLVELYQDISVYVEKHGVFEHSQKQEKRGGKSR